MRYVVSDAHFQQNMGPAGPLIENVFVLSNQK